MTNTNIHLKVNNSTQSFSKIFWVTNRENHEKRDIFIYDYSQFGKAKIEPKIKIKLKVR